MAAPSRRERPLARPGANVSNVKENILIRVRLVFAFGILFFLMVAYRLVTIYEQKGEELLKFAESVKPMEKEQPSSRGNIYADDGASLLATSVTKYMLGMDPMVVTLFDNKDYKPTDTAAFNLRERNERDLKFFAQRLSQYYGDKSADEYLKDFWDARKQKSRFIFLNRKLVDYQTRNAMLKWPLVSKGMYKSGVVFKPFDKREKPFKGLASKLIGNMADPKAKIAGKGIEQAFNDTLTGTPGLSIVQMLRKDLPRTLSVIREPVDGLDVVTTLDINLQDVAEASLERELRRNGADNGCAILMEVKTGEIKAMANLGRVKGREDYVYTEAENYALTYRTEPGSTFKLASFLALLEANKVRITDSVHCNWGSITWAGKVMTDSKPGGYGNLSIRDAFAFSSNVGCSKLVDKHFRSNPKAFVNLIKQFGLTTDLQLQLAGSPKTKLIEPGEKVGWNKTSLTSMSIGYGVSLTPIQTLAFYNAVANDGVMMAPLIVKQIKRQEQVVKTYEPRVLRQSIASSHALAEARKLLEAVVEYGTAKNIREKEYKIAGKTGTAKKIDKGEYTQRYYATFAGYFPAEAPKYSCIVVIDNPAQPLYGADVAAPVFRELASKIYARDTAMHKELNRERMPDFDMVAGIGGAFGKGYKADVSAICNLLGVSNHANGASDKSLVVARPQARSLKLERIKVNKRLMPDVSDMTLRDVLPLLENLGLQVRYQGSGRVKSQSPEAGTSITSGTSVFLQLQKRVPPPQDMAIPNDSFALPEFVADAKPEAKPVLAADAKQEVKPANKEKPANKPDSKPASTSTKSDNKASAEKPANKPSEKPAKTEQSTKPKAEAKRESNSGTKQSKPTTSPAKKKE